ncbi:MULTISPECIES: VapE domain-containing protein [Maribacter]|uniref:Virulence-associated protein E n=2 Tax=Maribacter TaxID=252356 RepID=A0A1H4NQX1_9FLAO|nr:MULTISPECIES: VapE domain-containing protein [Maribacter]SDS99226.1 Virulence-associated protein E [Maribacter dokdonensis]SEB97656.1 Virulence-associated protein E [Maribacter dokdonensis]VXB83495.1 Virulence-associated protein E [Maribacter litoralis]
MTGPKKKLYIVEDSNTTTVFDHTLKYINDKYEIHFNEIALDFEIRLKVDDNEEWRVLNVEALYIELVQSGVNIPISKLEILLKSEYILKYNPVTRYFTHLPKWDKIDHITKLGSHLPVSEPEAFLYHLKKWMVRTVKCAVEPNYFNKQALIICHKAQNSGKSTWCRFLCPPELSNYIAEDISNDKDARILLCKNFLINLDELSSLTKKDVNSLKAFFTKTVINERLPYDRKSTIINRICSFIGSTNMSEFLNDETGSVRWLCFELFGQIDFRYSKEIEINKVWAQAYHLAYNDKSFNPELTTDDIKQNEERNKKYTNLSEEQELILKYYEKSDDKNDFKTATDILNSLSCISPRINKVNIGRALSGFNYTRVKSPKTNHYGYLAKELFIDTPWNIEFGKKK